MLAAQSGLLSCRSLANLRQVAGSSMFTGQTEHKTYCSMSYLCKLIGRFHSRTRG